MSSSMVSVPTMERSDPSSTFFTIESTCSGLASRKRSAALRRDSTSRPILNVATPCTWTLMPWLVTASLSWTLIWRAVSLSRPMRLSSGITMVPPPTTTFTPLSPGEEICWPRSSWTLAPREPATLYRLATKARIRIRMTTPVTTRNGAEVMKSGIGPSSFIGCHRGRTNDEVGACDGHDLHLFARRDLPVGGGGHVVRGARESDHHGPELVGEDAD